MAYNTQTRQAQHTPRRLLRHCVYIFITAFVFVHNGFVHGFPGGAGSCGTGQAPVFGSHLTNNPLTMGTLEEGQLEVRLDGTTLQSGGTSEFTIGESHVLTLVRNGGEGFRGFLVRLEAPDGVATEDALDFFDDEGARFADDVCVAPVVGLTHDNNSDKTSVNADLFFTEPVEGLLLEVTAVISNNGADGSEFYYTSYSLAAVAAAQDTPAPTEPPATEDPTGSPTSAPTEPPVTDAPADTAEPTGAPTTAPDTPAPTQPQVTEVPVDTDEMTDMPSGQTVTDAPTMAPTVPGSIRGSGNANDTTEAPTTTNDDDDDGNFYTIEQIRRLIYFILRKLGFRG